MPLMILLKFVYKIRSTA